MHIDNKEKDILIVSKASTQGLDGTTFTAEALYSIDFTHSRKRFVLSLHCNERNSFWFVNATKVYQSKAKDSEIKDYALCQGYVSKDFTINNMKKTRLKGVILDILVIDRYLIKRTWYKIMFGLKKIYLLGY